LARVFDQLGGAPRGEHQRRPGSATMAGRHRPAPFAHGSSEVADHECGPENLKSRIARGPSRRNSGFEAITTSAEGIGFADQSLRPSSAGADRHRRFGDDHREAGRGARSPRSLARGGVDISEVGMAIAPAATACPTAMNTASALGHRRSEIGRENRAALALTFGRRPSYRAPGSKIGNFAAGAKAAIFSAVLVHAGDLVAEIRKTGAGNQPPHSPCRSWQSACYV